MSPFIQYFISTARAWRWGWSDLKLINDAPDCMGVGDLSYDVLFRRVAAVVHHGAARRLEAEYGHAEN